MNHCKPNLRVQCQLRVDCAIEKVKQPDNTTTTSSSLSVGFTAHQLAETITRQMHYIFGISSGSVEIVGGPVPQREQQQQQQGGGKQNNNNNEPFSVPVPSEILPTLTLYSPAAGGAQRRQREDAEDAKNSNNNKNKIPSSTTTSAATAAAAPVVVRMVGFRVHAVLERQHLEQLRGACASITNVMRKPVRVSVIGGPKKAVVSI